MDISNSVQFVWLRYTSTTAANDLSITFPKTFTSIYTIVQGNWNPTSTKIPNGTETCSNQGANARSGCMNSFTTSSLELRRYHQNTSQMFFITGKA